MKVPLCRVENVREGEVTRVDFLGREALVFKVDGKPTAVLNYCMHLGGPMTLEGDRLVCEWHAAEFASRSGERLSGPARPGSRLIVLPTSVEEGTVQYEYPARPTRSRVRSSQTAGRRAGE